MLDTYRFRFREATTVHPPGNSRAPSHAGKLAPLMLAASLGACGNNGAEVPPELIDAIRDRQSEQPSDYPVGPYGTEVGDTVANLCFDEGWRDPMAVNFDPAAFERICFSDFYDAAGAEQVILLVNAGAVWCTSCRLEYGGTAARESLSEALAARAARGFRLLGTLFQDTDSNPATPADGVLWAQTYDVDFPFAIDPNFEMGAFTQAASAPYNMLVDTRTMEIILSLEGDQPAIIFGAVDSFLADVEAGR